MPTFDFAPLLWWSLPLAAAPLLIHLINLLRQRRVKWAAMEFLLASQRRYRTRVLLRQILLLAVRTLAVVGFVAALALPRWTTATGFGGGQGASHLVMLDDSASMGDASGMPEELVSDPEAGDTRRATAFDRGCSAVARLAEELASSGVRHRLGVVLASRLTKAGDEPAWLVPLADVTPGRLQEIRDAVRDARAGDDAVGPREVCPALPGLVAAAGEGRRVLWLIGDARSRDWLGRDEPTATLRRLAGEGIELRLVDCGADAAAGSGGNVGVQRLEVTGGVPAANVVLPVEVELRNDSPEPVRDLVVTLREDGGGRPGLRVDEIPAGGAVTRRFEVRFPTAGSHTIEAELPADVLAADNVRSAVVEVAERADVLLVDGAAGAATDEDGDAFYVATALAPGSAAATGLRPTIIPPSAVAATDLGRYASIWMLDVDRLDPVAIASIEAHVRAGGGVVFFCGPRTRAEFVNGSLHRGGQGVFPVPLAGAIDLLPDPTGAASIPDVTADEHPVVAVLAGQRNPLLDAVRVKRFWAIDRGFDPRVHGGRRLLSLRTGQPLAVEKPFGEGSAVALLTTAAPVWNSWARANPSWVVVLLELESHLARLRRRAEATLVGEPLVVSLEAGLDEPEVDFLVPPDGAIIRQRATSISGSVLEARLTDTPRAGIYEARWRRIEGTERERSMAVTIDPGEGRLERAGRPRLEAALRGVPFRLDTAAEIGAAAGEAHGWSFTLPLLVAVAGLLLAEQFIAYTAGYHPVARRAPF